MSKIDGCLHVRYTDCVFSVLCGFNVSNLGKGSSRLAWNRTDPWKLSTYISRRNSHRRKK